MIEPLPPSNPSWRKPAGAFAIVLLIIAWCWLVVTLFEWAVGWPVWAQMIFYAIAGVAWIFPARPILVWMETGRLR
jgi:hypothetical protein